MTVTGRTTEASVQFLRRAKEFPVFQKKQTDSGPCCVIHRVAGTGCSDIKWPGREVICSRPMPKLRKIYLCSSICFEKCALLGCYPKSSGNPLSTFRDSLSVPSSRDENSWLLNMGPIVYPEMSVRNYHYSLRDSPEERNSHYFAAEAYAFVTCKETT